MSTFDTLRSRETKSNEASGAPGDSLAAPALALAPASTSYPLSRRFAEAIFYKGYSEGVAHAHSPTSPAQPTATSPFDRLLAFAGDHPLLTVTMVLSVAGLGLAAKPAALRRGQLSTKPQAPGLLRLFSTPQGVPPLPAVARLRDLQIREPLAPVPSVVKVLDSAQHEIEETQARDRKDIREAEEAREARISEVEGRLEREGALEGARTRGIVDAGAETLPDVAHGYMTTTGHVFREINKTTSANDFVFPVERNTSTSIKTHRGESGISYANKSFAIISPTTHQLSLEFEKARQNGQTHMGVYGLVRIYTPNGKELISLQTRDGTTFKAHLLYSTSDSQIPIRISLDGFCLAIDNYGQGPVLSHSIGKLPKVSREHLEIGPGEQAGIDAVYETYFDHLQSPLVWSARERFEKREAKRRKTGHNDELFYFPDITIQPHSSYIARGVSGILYDKTHAIEIVRPSIEDENILVKGDAVEPVFLQGLVKVYDRFSKAPLIEKIRSGKTLKAHMRYEDVLLDDPSYIALDGHVFALTADNGHLVVDRCSGFLTAQEKGILAMKPAEAAEMEAACEAHLQENAGLFEQVNEEDCAEELISTPIDKTNEYFFPILTSSTVPPAIPKGTSGIRYDSNKMFEIIHTYDSDDLPAHVDGSPCFKDGIIVVFNKWTDANVIERLEQGVMLKARMRYDHGSLDSPSYISVDGFVFTTLRDAISSELTIGKCVEVVPEDTRLRLNPNAEERKDMSEIRKEVLRERRRDMKSEAAKEKEDFKAREATMLSNLTFPTTALMPAFHIGKSPRGIRYTDKTMVVTISPTSELLPCNQPGYVVNTEYVVPAIVVVMEASTDPFADYINRMKKGIHLKAVLQYKDDIPLKIAMDGCFFSLRHTRQGDDTLDQFLGGLRGEEAELLEVQDWERDDIHRSVEDHYYRLHEVHDVNDFSIVLREESNIDSEKPSSLASASSVETSATISPPLRHVATLDEWDFTSATLVNGRPAWVARAYEHQGEVFAGPAPSISEAELMDVIFARNGAGMEFFIEKSMEKGGWTLDTPAFGLKDASNERHEEMSLDIGLDGWERYHRWLVRVRGVPSEAHGVAFNGETRSFTCAVRNNFMQAKALYLAKGGVIELKVGKKGEHTIHKGAPFL
ncbi:hypothetical protein IAR50_006635 [Cryptococcus sp. DSM 104548]